MKTIIDVKNMSITKIREFVKNVKTNNVEYHVIYDEWTAVIYGIEVNTKEIAIEMKMKYL